jgi:hypothetical protein
MKTVKTVELLGAALDWAVAKCEYAREKNRSIQTIGLFGVSPNPKYSTDWAYGGPIITRLWLDGMRLEAVAEQHQRSLPPFKATLTHWETVFRGATPLIAAMRCYVASKLGDEIEIPGELC